MVQVLPARSPRGPNAFESLLGGLAEGVVPAIQQYQKKQAEEEQYRQENDTYSQLTGRSLSRNPRIREKEIDYALKFQHEFGREHLKQQNKLKEDAEKLRGQKQTQDQMMSFADRLEARDPKFKGVADIYRLDIPLDQKTKIVQSLMGTDVFREDQQRRLQMDSTLKRYNSRIKEIDEEIKNVRNPNSTGKDEINVLRRQRMDLRNERDQLLDFRALNGFENEEEDFDDVESEPEEEEEGPTVKFDANNPKHKAVAEKLFKKYKDKEKVRQILRKNFKGL
jgi:hypothetical protein